CSTPGAWNLGHPVRRRIEDEVRIRPRRGQQAHGSDGDCGYNVESTHTSILLRVFAERSGQRAIERMYNPQTAPASIAAGGPVLQKTLAIGEKRRHIRARTVRSSV